MTRACPSHVKAFLCSDQDSEMAETNQQTKANDGIQIGLNNSHEMNGSSSMAYSDSSKDDSKRKSDKHRENGAPAIGEHYLVRRSDGTWRKKIL